MKLYVGNLPAGTSDIDLKEIFRPFGAVISVLSRCCGNMVNGPFLNSTDSRLTVWSSASMRQKRYKPTIPMESMRYDRRQREIDESVCHYFRTKDEQKMVYHFKDFKYDNFNDALVYARIESKRKSETTASNTSTTN
jgi:RNA recognition motif-containing protein